MSSPRARLELIEPTASPEEAAGIVAALELFLQETYIPAAGDAPALAGWARAAMLEGVGGGAIAGDVPHPWINT